METGPALASSTPSTRGSPCNGSSQKPPLGASAKAQASDGLGIFSNRNVGLGKALADLVLGRVSVLNRGAVFGVRSGSSSNLYLTLRPVTVDPQDFIALRYRW